MTAARRLAATLAADVVRLLALRLMGEDETGTAQPMRSRARWTKPKPRLRNCSASIPSSPSNRYSRLRRISRPLFDGLRKAGLPEE